jgi:hypothetical protein
MILQQTSTNSLKSSAAFDRIGLIRNEPINNWDEKMRF